MNKIKQNKKRQNDENIINNKFRSLFSSENLRITCYIIPYLTYKEVISLSKVNKSFHKTIRSHKVIKSYIIKSKLQPESRLLFYSTNLNLSSIKLTIEQELSEYKIKDNYYQKILSLAKEAYNKDKKFKKICDEIDRDLHRTFYNKKFTKGNGRQMLRNVLISIGFIRPEIGYCQGMNFIGGALINLIDNEEKCFWIFLSFIDNINLNLLYLKNMPDFLIRVYQLKKFMEFYFPKLYNHLRRTQINIDLFFSKWLLTIFANYFPFDVLYKVWDVFIIDKWKALFKFCMIILFFMKEDMMKMDLGMFFDYFRSDEVLTSLSFEQMIKHYNDYKITNKKLKELKEDYYVSQVEAKLNNPNTEWEDDQNEYVINYKKELEYHLKMVKEPMDNLLKKIEKIDKEYDIKLEKYDKQFDIVSKLKIEIDAKNEVKTGYENILKNLGDNNNINNENNDNNNKLNNTEGILGSIKSFFTTDNSENAKIQKKIKDINKILEEKIKNLNYNEKILDKYKNELEKSRNEQNLLKQQLLNMEKNSNKTKKDLLKNLSEKLKLSAKFVATSKY
jgi:hypothetical protein